MYFRKTYKPIPMAYNLVLAMLWRHPENVGELEKVKVVHYCAAVSDSFNWFHLSTPRRSSEISDFDCPIASE